MRFSSWRWGLVVGALLVGWGGCLFNPQPEPPAAVDSLPPDGGAGGTGAYGGLGGGPEGEGGDMAADGFLAGGEPEGSRVPVGGAGGAGGGGGAGGAGGSGGQGPAGGSGGST